MPFQVSGPLPCVLSPQERQGSCVGWRSVQGLTGVSLRCWRSRGGLSSCPELPTHPLPSCPLLITVTLGLVWPQPSSHGDFEFGWSFLLLGRTFCRRLSEGPDADHTAPASFWNLLSQQSSRHPPWSPTPGLPPSVDVGSAPCRAPASSPLGPANARTVSTTGPQRPGAAWRPGRTLSLQPAASHLAPSHCCGGHMAQSRASEDTLVSLQGVRAPMGGTGEEAWLGPQAPRLSTACSPVPARVNQGAGAGRQVTRTAGAGPSRAPAGQPQGGILNSPPSRPPCQAVKAALLRRSRMCQPCFHGHLRH